MKKLSLLMALILVAAVWSCKKKQDKPVYEYPKCTNIVVNGKSYGPANTSGTFKAGDTLNFSVTFTDDRGLANVDISQAHSGIAWSACGYDTIFKTQSLSGTEQTVTFQYKVPLFMDMDQKNCITFYLTDTDDDEDGPKKAGFLFTILIKPESKAYTFTYANARVYNYQSTNGMQCWNIYTNASADKSTYNYNFYNDTYVGDLSTSPGYKSGVYNFGGWSRKAPAGFNYAAANDSVCDAVYNTLSNFAQNQNVSVGDVFIAPINSYRKYTVYKITNIVNTTGDNNDYTEFEYKRYNLTYYQ